MITRHATEPDRYFWKWCMVRSACFHCAPCRYGITRLIWEYSDHLCRVAPGRPVCSHSSFVCPCRFQRAMPSYPERRWRGSSWAAPSARKECTWTPTGPITKVARGQIGTWKGVLFTVAVCPSCSNGNVVDWSSWTSTSSHLVQWDAGSFEYWPTGQFGARSQNKDSVDCEKQFFLK